MSRFHQERISNMAKLKKRGSAIGISGMIGKGLIFRQMPNGTTVVSAAPDFSNRVFSEQQVTHQNRFKQATAYAKFAARTNPIYAELALAGRTNAYNLALSDWFHAPVIHQVTRQGDCIRVNATDNVQVTKVLITMFDEQGTVLEQGEAALITNDWWEYRTTIPDNGNIVVEACDLAGNASRHEA
jgi:hypothetical protein